MLKNDFTPGDDISHLGFKDGTFIYQPYSSHGAPDFVIFVNNTYIMMELKSAKGENIQWNTHVPQKNWIYVFTSKSHKKTTYFLGQEIVPDEMRPHLEELIALEKHHKEIMKQIWLKLPGNKFKFWNYNRPMYMADLKLFTDGETLDREVKVNDFINNILNGK